MTRRELAALSAAALVIGLALVYMLPSTIGQASEMDEGAVVAYASNVLDGRVPHRDFLTFYGPGNPWLVASAFAVFGETVGVERAVGFLYRALIVIALLVLGWRAGGLVGGLAAALVAATIIGDGLIWAYATWGALAFALVGLALLSIAADRTERATWFAVSAGAASGVATLIRFDFAPAVLVGSLPILLLAPNRVRTRFAVALAVAFVVYAVHFAIVGPARIRRLGEDILAAGPGRYLQRQTMWDYPGNLLTVSGFATTALVVVGALLAWRKRDDLGPRIVLAAGLFSVGLVPLTISRMDPPHIRPFAVLPLAMLPGLLLLLSRNARGQWLRVAYASVVSAAVLWGVVHYGHYTIDHFRSARGVPSGYRGFYDDDSTAARTMVERLQRVGRPGESLFVGPQDLRRTNYGPTYMYFLLRDLRPASYYMEMNPGTANREGSGLPEDLRAADWLILTSEWDDWDEPNDSQDYGSPEPNRVVRDDFCLRLSEGQYRLYERCDRAAA